MFLRNSFVRLLKLLFGTFLVLVTNVSLGQVEFRDLPGSLVARESFKKLDFYEVVYAPIAYREADAESEESGYWPKNLVEIKGSVAKTTYDHKKEDSALSIFKEFQRWLSKTDYTIINSCIRADCGDVSAYRLYLSDEISGSIESQFYVVAKRETAASVDYLVFYVNDIGERPRSILHAISQFVEEEPLLNIGERELADIVKQEKKLDLPAALFEFDSFSITSTTEAFLGKLISAVDLTNYQEIRVVGHTDDVGQLPYNMELSKKRAQAVRDSLMRKLNVEIELTTYGLGPLAPKVANISQQARRKNRRVEILFVGRES